MGPHKTDDFRSLIVVDFEFSNKPGDIPHPVCAVFLEIRSAKTVIMWKNELEGASKPPFDTGPGALWISFYAPAEMSCFLELGWGLPEYLIDLYAEYRLVHNGDHPPDGYGLLGACKHFGIESMDPAEKEASRKLIQENKAWTQEARQHVMRYCAHDVHMTCELFKKMKMSIDFPRALIRGRYTQAVASMEKTGVPIDRQTLLKIGSNWDKIKISLVERIDENYGVYEGTRFVYDRFERYIASQRIPWPRLESGRLALDDDTFRQMAKAYPDLSPLRELRSALSQLRLNALSVGPDGRNRCMLSPFRSITGRNQPSNSRSIFGPSVWTRGLIKPAYGHALAYIDWDQQEFGIAASLSRDKKMMEAYASGDPYMSFAIQAGAAPPGATKKTHGSIREIYKQVALALQYGMGRKTLALRIDRSEAEAAELIRSHKRTYARFWTWSDAVVNFAMSRNYLYASYGWKMKVTGQTKGPTLQNFPMQANGAEMLRLACIFCIEAGVKVCCPVHDALLIESTQEDIEADIETTQAMMARASQTVLEGFTLRTEYDVVRYPERYMDKRGKDMWEVVMSLIDEGDCDAE